MWDSRKDNNVWGIGDHHINHLPYNDEKYEQDFHWQEDHFHRHEEYNPDGWKPLHYVKNVPRSIYEIAGKK